MVAHHDRRARKEYLQRDAGLHAEPDGIDEVDNLRAGGAQGAQEGGEYEAAKVEIEYTSVYMRG
jgi:hypothetical protein